MEDFEYPKYIKEMEELTSMRAARTKMAGQQYDSATRAAIAALAKEIAVKNPEHAAAFVTAAHAMIDALHASFEKKSQKLCEEAYALGEPIDEKWAQVFKAEEDKKLLQAIDLLEKAGLSVAEFQSCVSAEEALSRLPVEVRTALRDLERSLDKIRMVITEKAEAEITAAIKDSYSKKLVELLIARHRVMTAKLREIYQEFTS